MGLNTAQTDMISLFFLLQIPLALIRNVKSFGKRTAVFQKIVYLVHWLYTANSTAINLFFPQDSNGVC